MIKNERQYRITRARLADARAEFSTLEGSPLPDGVSQEMRGLQVDALTGVIAELEGELATYDSLTGASVLEANGLSELPLVLIRARIAQGLTQRDMAERVGVAEQAIQRYEANDYAGASFARLVEVAEALGVAVAIKLRLDGSPA